jgi:hypothetical protein
MGIEWLAGVRGERINCQGESRRAVFGESGEQFGWIEEGLLKVSGAVG